MPSSRPLEIHRALERLSPPTHTKGPHTPDDLTADDLEQLAQSPAVDGSLGRADTLRLVEVLQELARSRRSD